MPPALSPVSGAQPKPLNQHQLDIDNNLRQLADQDARIREEAVMQLGRLRAQRAIDPLAATLAGDKSAAVRDAAARALGLIGSPKALPALRRAAQLDTDKDVRRSAQFSIEVVQVRTER
jgi:HEAT repeat protein